MKYLPLLGLILLCGCASGVDVVYKQDLNTGKVEKIVYSPLFMDDADLAGSKINSRIIVVNEKKVNPVTHGLAQSIGALGPDDMNKPCSVSIHLRNSDTAAHQIALKSFTAMNKEYALSQSFELASGQIARSEIFNIMLSDWGLLGEEKQQFSANLVFLMDGQEKSQAYMIERKTVKEAKELMKK